MIRLFCILMSALLITAVHSENFDIAEEQMHFKRIASKDGLPSVYINTLLQRQDGLMWIGTKGGLVRFDGQNMVNYHYNAKNTNSLKSDDITSLFEDKSSKLWVGTATGLYIFNDTTNDFSSVLLSNKNKQPVIFTLFEEPNKRIWVGTDQGVYLLNHQHEIIWHGFKEQSIKFITQSSIEKVWIGGKKGLSIINPLTLVIRQFPLNKNTNIKIKSSRIFAGLLDQSFIWLATDRDGLIQIDHKNEIVTQQVLSNDNSINSNSIWTLTKQGDELLLGYFYDGISRFNINNSTNSSSKYHPQIDYTIPHNNVSSVYFDKSGLLWVGTTNGLAVTNPNNRIIRQLGEYQNITNKHVWSVAKHNDDIWFGSEDGLNKINLTSNQLTTYLSSLTKGLLPKTVLWSIVPSEKLIWLGSNQGLLAFDPVTTTTKNIENPFIMQDSTANKAVYSMTLNNNELLIGYYNGSFARFDLATHQFTDFVKNVSSGYIKKSCQLPKDI